MQRKNYRIAMIALFNLSTKIIEENGASHQFRIELIGMVWVDKGEKLPAHMQKEEILRFFQTIETTEFKPYAQAKSSFD